MEYTIARDCMKVILDFIEKCGAESSVTFLYIDDASTLDLQNCENECDYGHNLGIAIAKELTDLIRKIDSCESHVGYKDYIFVYVGDKCMRFLTVRARGSLTYTDGLYFVYNRMTGECALYELCGKIYCAWGKKSLDCDHQIFGCILNHVFYRFYSSSVNEKVTLHNQARAAIEKICLG